MQLRTLLIGLIFSLTFTSLANAAPDILPGLWENSVKMSTESGQLEAAMQQQMKMMEQQLANMPAEQRKMMEDMMKQQMGGSMNPFDRTVQTCLTQTEIDNFEIAKTEDGCEQNFEEKSKNHFVFSMKCPSQNMAGQGDFHVQDKKHYNGTIVMEGNINGQQEKMTLKQTGTWLAADCGDVKPE